MKYFHHHGQGKEDFDEKLKSSTCTHIKDNGQQCKNKVVIGQPLCWIHNRTVKNVKIAISQIQEAGLGLYAFDSKENDNAIIFKKGEKICRYYGEHVDQEELVGRYGDYTAPYGFQIRNNVFQDAAIQRGVGSLINHNRQNKNCRFSTNTRNTMIWIVATKAIRNNKELYIDYGKDYKLNEPNVQTSTNNRKYTA